MSSVLAHTATVTPRRLAYLLCGAATDQWTVSTGFTVQQVMTTTAFAAATTKNTGSQIADASVLKDMGDEIRTVDSNGFHTASFRRVQVQLGEGAGGVGGADPSYLTYYVCVWSANPTLNTEAYPAVTVARLG